MMCRVLSQVSHTGGISDRAELKRCGARCVLFGDRFD
jgi:hypothetical protein